MFNVNESFSFMITTIIYQVCASRGARWGLRGTVVALYYATGEGMNAALSRNIHYWDYLHYNHHHESAMKTYGTPA